MKGEPSEVDSRRKEFASGSDKTHKVCAYAHLINYEEHRFHQPRGLVFMDWLLALVEAE